MDVIGLDPAGVRGTHGLKPLGDAEGPVCLSSSPVGAADRLEAAGLKDLILETVFRSG